MPVEVKLPAILRQHTDGEAVVVGEGHTVRQVLEDLEARYPGLRARIVSDEGALHRFVNLYLNDEDVRYQGALETEVRDGDTIAILPAVAGGRGLREGSPVAEALG
ncbi:MAG TPA: ubiquitin-like small modifier protein 1 [Actinomycetota bacterium]|nr:ubiquitin-like small modifier protein 1 [Actinomycetota bacterium]